jgi:hypothetical protein
MKRIILDHFRRWWWVFALGAAYALVLGWSMAIPTDAGDLGHDKKVSGLALFFFVWIKVQGNMYVMQVFCLTAFTGAMLLLFDLQRGITRAVTALPLTARQIGRSWWLATVAIPAIGLTALFFLGAGAFCFWHPNKNYPTARLAMASLFLLLWLGMNFTIYSNQFVSNPGAGWNSRQGAGNLIITALALWMMFGFGFSANASKNPVKLAIFLCAGTLLTVVGWFRAGRFSPPRHKQAVALGRSGLRLTPLAPGRAPVPDGRGGIPFLISENFHKSFLTSMAAAAWMALVLAWQGVIKSWPQAFETLGAMASVFWVIIFLFLSPIVRQLRWLRTLPISATKLAAVLFALTSLPFLALGGLVAGIAALTCGIPFALQIAENYALVLAPASVCIFFAVRFGVGIPAYLVLLVTMAGSQMVPHRPIPFSLAGPVAAGVVLLAFLLTRHALRHSSRTYRIQATVFNKDPWGAAR